MGCTCCKQKKKGGDSDQFEATAVALNTQMEPARSLVADVPSSSLAQPPPNLVSGSSSPHSSCSTTQSSSSHPGIFLPPVGSPSSGSSGPESLPTMVTMAKSSQQPTSLYAAASSTTTTTLPNKSTLAMRSMSVQPSFKPYHSSSFSSNATTTKDGTTASIYPLLSARTAPPSRALGRSGSVIPSSTSGSALSSTDIDEPTRNDNTQKMPSLP